MKNNLHVFLGATVADAAARPLHWVYNQKKLQTYIKGKKDFTFLKKKIKVLFIILRLEKFQVTMISDKSCSKHWLKDMKIYKKDLKKYY